MHAIRLPLPWQALLTPGHCLRERLVERRGGLPEDGGQGWSRQHPHEFALVYGSPVLVYGSPVLGYQAPVDTIEPAVRIPRLLARTPREAAATGALRPPSRPLPGPRLVTDAVRELAGGAPPPPYEDLLERAITVWIALVGTISFELYGHLHNGITDYDAYFDAAMTVAADGAGLNL